MVLSDQLLKEFKYQSLFSEYLPSGFSIAPRENCAFDIFSVTPALKSDNIEPLSFTMSNFSTNDKRRVLYLPELTNYVKLINYMTDEDLINELCDISANDDHSYSHIVQNRDGEASFIKHEGDYGIVSASAAFDVDQHILHEQGNDEHSTYTENVVEKIIRAQGAKGILFIDISNCYKSIYTHYLSCIKLGLQRAKEQYKLSRADMTLVDNDYIKYKELDNLVRLLNTQESSGILTGPRVSNYIVEAFLSVIDRDIQNELVVNPHVKHVDFVRYVDDYEFFVFDTSNIDLIISSVENVFCKYRLTINEYKTHFLTFPYYVVKNLKKLFDSYSSDTTISNENLVELFNCYFSLEKDGVKGAIRYLIKSIKTDTTFENKKLYTTFLFNVLVNDSRSLVKVCQLIIRDTAKLEISSDHIDLVKRLLINFSDNKMDLECIWMIVLLKKIGCTTLETDILDKIIASDNDLAIIVLMNEFQISDDTFSNVVDSADSWILLYQLFLNNKITLKEFSRRSSIKSNLAFYRQLKKNNFSFYIS